GRLLEALQRDRVGAEVDAIGALELVGQEIDDHAIEVVAAERGIAVRRQHLEHPVLDREDRDVERAAAVGSFKIARTVSPAILPASLVAWRWASSKYAGTVTTASVTGWPR